MREAEPATAAKHETLSPGAREPYVVLVVRLSRRGVEEWGELEVNVPALQWDETIRERPATFSDVVDNDFNADGMTPEVIPGSNEANARKLREGIARATGWDASEIYSGGEKLDAGHAIRVHGAMKARRPLVVLGKGDVYDKKRWAPIAEKDSAVRSAGASRRHGVARRCAVS